MQKLGPGLLYAGAAVGVSHLVQSTRAGAEFGFALVGVVILSNILKYPFFQIGPRYSAVTGKTLLDGYEKLGKWAIVIFLFITLGTMFIIQGAITVVTAGVFEQLFKFNYDIRIESALILAIATVILIFGRYNLLDKIIKFIIILLSLSTLISLLGAVKNFSPPTVIPASFSLKNQAHFFFLMALVGWMPAPVDLSVWHSIWCVEKNKKDNSRTSLKDAMLDFNVGFVGTMFLALGFLSLGALVMYGTGEAFPSSASAFSGKLIELYTKNLGPWAAPIIAIACFTTMLSTTLTVLDAYPRMMRKMTTQLLPAHFNNDQCKKIYNFWLIFMATGTVFFIFQFLQNMKTMVDFATIVSFVVAPLNALLNYLVIQDKTLPKEASLSKPMKVLSFVGLSFLSIFALVFLLLKAQVVDLQTLLHLFFL